MKLRIFISYSHLDEKYKNEIDAHLSLLKRNGKIETWNDRRIIPGAPWGSEISENLSSSDVILFLVSSDFIASEYCYDIEAQAALKMHAEGRATLIPIIVRPCDWQDSPLGALQALPADAKPVANWTTRDDAWLNVVAGLKKAIQADRTPSLIPAPKEEVASTNPRFTHTHESWLEDTEIGVTNGSHGSQIRLSDIFIYPDLKWLNESIDKLIAIESARCLVEKTGFSIIFGDEQSGRTSLAKTIIKELKNNGQYALYIHGSDIKNADISKQVNAAALVQFQGITEDFLSCAHRKSLIIDNYSSCRLNKKFQNILIEHLKPLFDRIILFASESFQYVSPEIESLDGFSRFELMRFGNVKRAELIERWVKIGKEEEISEQELYSGIDELKTHLDTFVKRNIVPSKPIYLISILQASTLSHLS